MEFVKKNVKLRGQLHHVTEKGLEVEHIPISVPFLTAIQRKCEWKEVKTKGRDKTLFSVWLRRGWEG